MQYDGDDNEDKQSKNGKVSWKKCNHAPNHQSKPKHKDQTEIYTI